MKVYMFIVLCVIGAGIIFQLKHIRNELVFGNIQNNNNCYERFCNDNNDACNEWSSKGMFMQHQTLRDQDFELLMEDQKRIDEMFAGRRQMKEEYVSEFTEHAKMMARINCHDDDYPNPHCFYDLSEKQKFEQVDT